MFITLFLNVCDCHITELPSHLPQITPQPPVESTGASTILLQAGFLS